MPTNSLLSDDLWKKIAEQSADHKRIRAAIAYVTANHLNFRNGDLLVCDASDDAIKGGLTSASLLRIFANQGAEIYSYDGLHSKVAVIDDQALVGSANMSENAGIGTCEASLLTDDPQIFGLIQGFIEAVRREGVAVTDRFLDRIESLPITQKASIRRISKKRIDIGESRVWFISTEVISDKIAKKEDKLDQLGTKEAEKHLKPNGYEVSSIRWSGRSRFRAEAKKGDTVIEIFTEMTGKRKRYEVYPPVPILHRLDGQSWTRFYLEIPSNQRELHRRWRDVKAEFAKLGIINITPSTTRELIGKSKLISQMIL